MVTPEEMIDRLEGVMGRHAGCRVLHAKGTLCTGTFTATPAARRLTKAAHMQGDPIPATVRLSNGNGHPKAPDAALDVRGLAVKLYLPDGTRTDLSTQTVSRPPTSTPDEFINLVEASMPKPSSAVKFPLHLIAHPKAIKALPAVAAGSKPPKSYATARYYAFHAYKFVDADGGERWIRYTFVPAAGEAKAGKEDKARGSDFLQEELAERLVAGPIRFALEVQIAAEGDNPHDPCDVWPDDRERVTVGTLEVTGLDTERETKGDVVVFDPTRVTDGIELSEDPILRFRSPAYSVSIERRSGIPRPADYGKT